VLIFMALISLVGYLLMVELVAHLVGLKPGFISQGYFGIEHAIDHKYEKQYISN
jgi:hypothetical protein